MAITNSPATGKMNYLTIGSNTYEIEDKNAAPLNSPAFTGVPTAPTATTGTSTTQIATTEFVQNAMSGAGAGTVTSVGVSNATNGGLSVSGSPITGSGTISIGHSNVLTSAQTTEAVYPIKIDKNGHISAYGSAVTIPDVSGKIDTAGTGLSKSGTTLNHSNSITAQSTEALYPIKIDAQGHISSYGTAVTIPTVPTNLTWYGTSSTTASTAAKTVTCSGFALATGAIVGVLFSTANTAATPTLNVNSTGAKSIYVGSATPSATDNVLKWSANTLVYFQYDGTYFRYITSISAGSVVPSRGANTWYGTSSTGATTQAKTSTIDNFVLTKGAVVYITFSTANTYSSAKITLNINSTGAKDVYYNNAVTSSTNTLPWNAGETLIFIYSGSYWYYAGKSVTKVSQLVNDSGYITSYTDEKLAIAEVESATQYYPIVGTGTTAKTRQYDTTGFIYIGTNGTANTVGTANLTLGNATASGTVNNKRGQIYLYGTGTGRTQINTNVTSGTSTVSFPDKGGTVALTDDLPSITLNGSSTTSPSFYAPTGAGTSGYYLKSNGSGAPSWTAFPTIPSITLNGSATTSPSFYAPTSAGTNGYVLKSNGSGAPSWTSATLTDINVQTNVATSGNTYRLIGTSATSFPTTGVTYLSNTQVTIGTDTTTLYVGTVNFPGQIGLSVTSGGEGFYTIIKSAATAGRTITLPNATGTVALTSNIPTITLNGSSTTSPSFYAPTSAGTNGYYLKSNGSGAPTWAEVTAGVSDVTVGGTSVVTSGVAAIASPVQIVRW